MALCLGCGGELPPKKRPSGGSEKVYCSKACGLAVRTARRDRRESSRRYEESHREQIAAYRRELWLRRKADRDARKAARREQRAVEKAALALERRRELAERNRRPCAECGTSFAPRKASTKFCSSACGWRAGRRTSPSRAGEKRRRRRLILVGEGFTLAQVGERDGWVCHLCGEAAERVGDPNGDWWPSIDHVVPVVDGGPDTLANVLLAHRWCNSVRRTRPLEEARELFGVAA